MSPLKMIFAPMPKNRAQPRRVTLATLCMVSAILNGRRSNISIGMWTSLAHRLQRRRKNSFVNKTRRAAARTRTRPFLPKLSLFGFTSLLVKACSAHWPSQSAAQGFRVAPLGSALAIPHQELADLRQQLVDAEAQTWTWKRKPVRSTCP